MSMRRVLALAVFAARTNARMWVSRAGVAGGVATILLGAALRWNAGYGWSADADLAFNGFLIMALFTLRSGLEEQVGTGLSTFIRHNFASPAEHALAGSLSLVATLLGCAGVSLLVLIVAQGGDLAASLWTVWHWLLLGAMILPFVPMVEAVARFRLPAVLPAIGYFALLVILSLTIGEERAMAFFAGGGNQADPASSLPFAARAGAFLALGFAAYVGGTGALARLRSRLAARVRSG